MCGERPALTPMASVFHVRRARTLTHVLQTLCEREEGSGVDLGIGKSGGEERTRPKSSTRRISRSSGEWRSGENELAGPVPRSTNISSASTPRSANTIEGVQRRPEWEFKEWLGERSRDGRLD